MIQDQSWIDEIKAYCEEFNIPPFALPKVINDLKVIPMIRGKAFEFSAFEALRSFLPSAEWDVTKPALNAQFGSDDMDVRVFHRGLKQEMSIECKMSAGKGVIHLNRKKTNPLRLLVKCMRSRTLGKKQAKKYAEMWGLDVEAVENHADSYRARSFDIVMTSIGNSFYRTDKTLNTYVWNPTPLETAFLTKLAGKEAPTNLKDFAFGRMYVAKAVDLVVSKESGIRCSRKSCTDKDNCGFMNNYPPILFNPVTYEVLPPWIELESSIPLFEQVAEDLKAAGIDRDALAALETAIEEDGVYEELEQPPLFDGDVFSG